MLKVIYEDNHLLVCEKPVNMPVQADSSGDMDLLTLAKRYIKEKYDNMVTLYSYIKNAKMTYRVPISNKLVGFRLRSLNRFVYKINELI